MNGIKQQLGAAVEDGVSILLSGPPGSGKCTLVKTYSEVKEIYTFDEFAKLKVIDKPVYVHNVETFTVDQQIKLLQVIDNAGYSIICSTYDPGKLYPALKSRLLALTLARPTYQELLSEFNDSKVAYFADGDYRQAHLLAQSGPALNEKLLRATSALAVIRAVGLADMVTGLKTLEKLRGMGASPSNILTDLIKVVKILLQFSLNVPVDLPEMLETPLKEISSLFDAGNIRVLLQMLWGASDRMTSFVGGYEILDLWLVKSIETVHNIKLK